jgi:hypothetical protein
LNCCKEANERKVFLGEETVMTGNEIATIVGDAAFKVFAVFS